MHPKGKEEIRYVLGIYRCSWHHNSSTGILRCQQTQPWLSIKGACYCFPANFCCLQEKFAGIFALHDKLISAYLREIDSNKSAENYSPKLQI